ncbi:MAG: uridine kinase [Clostridia bacterium]|nr:uridine kinase [Clostridia bacterium]
MKPYIIGLAGGSGSGKSTFAKRLIERFPGMISLLSCDNYYLPHDDLSMEERATLNYDSPDAFEFSLLVRQLAQLKEGICVNCPVYDFTKHTRSSEHVEIEARPVIIIDGILLFYEEALRAQIDLKVYVETDADERVLRRALRDIQERGRNLNNIIEQYLGTVKPMHSKYVEPTKKYADIIINGGLNEVALDLVSEKVRRLLAASIR